MSEQSETIGKLAEALSAAQAEIEGARKTSANPFFKSSYADLAACWDAIREPLAKHKLAIVQTTEAGEGEAVIIITTLAHASGEWIRGRLRVSPKKAGDPQALGSAITYGRRYALTAIVGLAQVDDDGESAMGRGADRSERHGGRQRSSHSSLRAELRRAETPHPPLRRAEAGEEDEHARIQRLFDEWSSVLPDLGPSYEIKADDPFVRGQKSWPGTPMELAFEWQDACHALARSKWASLDDKQKCVVSWGLHLWSQRALQGAGR